MDFSQREIFFGFIFPNEKLTYTTFFDILKLKKGCDLNVIKCVYTVHEIAKILHVSDKTVYRIVKSGDIHATRVRNQIRITSASLEAYLQGGKS